MEDLTKQLNVERKKSLATGGFGELYGAFWLSSSANGLLAGDGHIRAASPKAPDVAVKFPIVRFCSGSSRSLTISKLAERWNRELDAGQTVIHPNLLLYLGTCDNPDPQYKQLPGVVLPYCANGNVLDYLAKKPHVDHLPILCGVGAALVALHSAVTPVVHGDIKARNILIGDDGQALLSDFGLSRVCDVPGFTTSNIHGTCRWMAVELFQTDESIRTSTASDVWAFAMTILEVLTGEPPFADIKSDIRIPCEILVNKGRPKRPGDSRISDAIWSLLERCWLEDPNARPDARHAGLVLDLICGYALNDDDIHTVSGVLDGTWDTAVPYRRISYASDSSLPYRCKWLHCSQAFVTMEECIEHECAELAVRRAGAV